MQQVKGIILLGVSLLVVACGGEPKLDASSSQNLQASLEAVRQSLPVDRRDAFDSAYQEVALGGEDLFSFGTNMLASASEGELPPGVKSRLDGRTASDIFHMADSLRVVEIKEEVASLEERIANLAAEKQRAARARENLESFQVLSSEFYIRENALGMEEPILDLTIKNGTDTAISRAFFTGTIKSPDRAVPWLDSESFNYKIPGGVEPGERVRWQLKPNMFSEWGNVEAPEDAQLFVKVVELEDPSGETLWSSRSFGDEEQAELDTMRTRLDSLRGESGSLEN